MTPKLLRFLDQVRPITPYLVVDTDVVEANYLALAAALDGVQIFYAVKANPAPEILGRLAALGCSFDVASPDQHAPSRFNTTVPQQALFLMNSPFVTEQAKAVAARVC